MFAAIEDELTTNLHQTKLKDLHAGIDGVMLRLANRKKTLTVDDSQRQLLAIIKAARIYYNRLSEISLGIKIPAMVGRPSIYLPLPDKIQQIPLPDKIQQPSLDVSDIESARTKQQPHIKEPEQPTDTAAVVVCITQPTDTLKDPKDPKDPEDPEDPTLTDLTLTLKDKKKQKKKKMSIEEELAARKEYQVKYRQKKRLEYLQHKQKMVI